MFENGCNLHATAQYRYAVAEPTGKLVTEPPHVPGAAWLLRHPWFSPLVWIKSKHRESLGSTQNQQTLGRTRNETCSTVTDRNFFFFYYFFFHSIFASQVAKRSTKWRIRCTGPASCTSSVDESSGCKPAAYYISRFYDQEALVCKRWKEDYGVALSHRCHKKEWWMSYRVTIPVTHRVCPVAFQAPESHRCPTACFVYQSIWGCTNRGFCQIGKR